MNKLKVLGPTEDMLPEGANEWLAITKRWLADRFEVSEYPPELLGMFLPAFDTFLLDALEKAYVNNMFPAGSRLSLEDAAVRFGVANVVGEGPYCGLRVEHWEAEIMGLFSGLNLDERYLVFLIQLDQGAFAERVRKCLAWDWRNHGREHLIRERDALKMIDERGANHAVARYLGEGVRYVDIEFIDGDDLKKLCGDAIRAGEWGGDDGKKKRDSFRRVCGYFEMALNALQEVHGINIVHRDMKGGNVLIVDEQAKIIDWECAADLSADKKFGGDVSLCTPGVCFSEPMEDKRLLDVGALLIQFLYMMVRMKKGNLFTPLGKLKKGETSRFSLKKAKAYCGQEGIDPRGIVMGMFDELKQFANAKQAAEHFAGKFGDLAEVSLEDLGLAA